ncbi:hypothetical protein [Euryhalocaulis caribicus]|nr:hypothetical protein [Euryhalocaulis caribicus]
MSLYELTSMNAELRRRQGKHDAASADDEEWDDFERNLMRREGVRLN